MDSLKEKIVSDNIISSLKTALVFLVIYINFLIFKPFLLIVIWAIIIAVALYPLHQKLQKLLKGNTKLSAMLITVIVLSLITIPCLMFAGELFESIQKISNHLEAEVLIIPVPSKEIADLPVVGESIYEAWNVFSTNIDKGLEQFQPQVRKIATWLLSTLTAFVKSFFMFLVAIIIAGVFLVNADKCYEIANKIFGQLIGGRGTKVLNDSKKTISSVVNGVLGTAIIQTAIISIGFFVADVQGASFLTIIVLICAIVQLPLLVVVLPVIIYIYPDLSGFGAALFIAWMILGSVSDNFLKPMLLGRGMDIPMLVILIGSIGGMILMGIVGLFIGAVCFALGYELFNSWVYGNEKIEEKESLTKSPSFVK
jgi:predicted PurR-regulated permease PerM